MEFEWDEDKSAENIRRRGFGFDLMADFQWGLALLLEVQWVDGEERELSVGPIGSTLYTVVTTERETATRIISLRRASQHDISRWRSEFQNG